MRAMVTALSIMVATLVAGSGIDLHSSTHCPSSDAIRASLQPLLPELGTGDAAWVDVATPEPSGESRLRVRLLRPDGSVVADRHLAVQGTCDEMADTIATVLATWEIPQAEPTRELGTRAASAIHENGARPREIELRVGAGGGAGFVGGVAPAGAVELRAGRPGSHLHAHVAVVGQTNRDRNLEPGSVAWRRTLGALGLGWKSDAALAAAPRWQASVNGGLRVGWLSVTGQGFAPGRSQDIFELGADVGLRAERVFGAWSVWIDGRVCWWPRAQRAVVADSASLSVELPRYDLVATLGFSRLAFP